MGLTKNNDWTIYKFIKRLCGCCRHNDSLTTVEYASPLLLLDEDSKSCNSVFVIWILIFNPIKNKIFILFFILKHYL
jgi:hypothetical protein